MDTDHRITRLEVQLGTVLPTLATKGDVSEAKADIIKWSAGIGFAIATIMVTVLAFMLNRAVPMQSVGQPSPIVIFPQAPAPPVASQSLQSSPEIKRGQDAVTFARRCRYMCQVWTQDQRETPSDHFLP